MDDHDRDIWASAAEHDRGTRRFVRQFFAVVFTFSLAFVLIRMAIWG